MNSLTRLALALAACSTAPAVGWAATASATIDDISIRLIDLIPGDGAAARLTWLTAQTVVQVSGENVDLSQTFSSTGFSQSFQSLLARSESVTAVEAQAGVGATSMVAAGKALAPRTEFSASGSTGQTSFNTGVVGAGTQLIFTATGFVTVSAFNFCSMNNFQACDYAEANVKLTTQASIFGGTTQQIAGASVTGQSLSQDNVIGDSRPIQFNWILSNTTTTDLPFQFLLSADVYAREFSASAVPELPVHALFALGLAGLGMQAARRRRGSAGSAGRQGWVSSTARRC